MDIHLYLLHEYAEKIQKNIDKNRKRLGYGLAKYNNVTGIPIVGNLLTKYQIPIIIYEQPNGDRIVVLDHEHIIATISCGGEEVILC